MMALPDDQEAWLASLTVAKLKDELKARNINVPSTKKLKAELQELLRQALLEEPSNAKQPSQPDPVPAEPAAPEPAEPEKAAAASTPDHAPADEPKDPEQPVLKDAVSSKEEALTVHELLHDEEELEPEEADPAAPAEEATAEQPARQPSPEPAPSPEKAPEQAPDEAPAAQEAPAAAQAPTPRQPAATPSSTEAAPADGVTSGRRKREPIPLYQPRSTDKPAAGKEAQADEPSESPAAGAASTKPAVESPAAAQQPLESPRATKTAATPKASTPRGKPTPAAAAPAATPELPPADPTSALLIENLVRPFTEIALRKLLGQTGTLLALWMPSIKTHAFCIFESQEQAAATRQALHGQQWPQGTPKKLAVSFISKAEAELAILKGTNPRAAAEVEAAAAAARKAEAEAARKAAAAAAAKEAAKKEKGSSGAGDSEDGKEGSEEPVQRAGSTEPAPAKPAAAVPLGAVAAAKRAMAAAASQGLKRGRMGDEQGPDAKRGPGVGMLGGPQAMEVEEAEPIKSLDELFRKTQTKPPIYWLPLTDEQVVVKKKREQLEEEHRARQEAYLAREREEERLRARDDSRGRGYAGPPSLPGPPPLPGPPTRRW